MASSQKTLRVRRTALLLSVLGGVAAWLPSCMPSLDPISLMNNTRILGVQKSAPYARPGEQVTLHMLWEDARTDTPRDVQTFFGFWCINPPGDLYAQCFAQEPTIPPHIVFDENKLTIEIPDDALREEASTPGFPPYGTAFVFYAACAGQLMMNGQPVGGGGGAGGAGGVSGAGAAGGEGGETSNLSVGVGLPTCVDENGQALGADDFVFGYSTIFVYEDLRNGNPVITGFEQDGEPVAYDCIDEDCDGPMPTPNLEGCVSGTICVDRCEKENSDDCPEIPLAPVIDEDSIEKDSLAEVAYGEDLDESVWVSYFVDRGAISDVRLVNDAVEGFNPEYSGKLRAPSEPGPIRIWAAVRDNRGGISWVRAPGYVR